MASEGSVLLLSIWTIQIFPSHSQLYFQRRIFLDVNFRHCSSYGNFTYQIVSYGVDQTIDVNSIQTKL